MRRRMMLLSLSALVATGAVAQPYPTRPVRFLVPFIPGSAPDRRRHDRGEHGA
jgi:tripartite-type tricarboxylate transporter receptor subunit TctC